MGKRTENAKNFIVSCRVNHEELGQLQSLARQQGASISELLRKSLILLQGDPRLSA
jgi:hypothetical protein